MKAECFLPVVVAVLFAAVGCSEGRFEIVPVSGVVTIDGEPIAEAYVNFQPQATGEDGLAGVGSFGRTDANGRYELMTIKREPGAVVAPHQVRIQSRLSKDSEDGTRKILVRKEMLPPKYHSRTELTFEVPPGGTDQANFDLTTE
jgi:hypothetical protein